MRQRSANLKVGPPVGKAFYGFPPGNIQCVAIDTIDFGERFDEVRRIALIPAKSGPNRVGINCYMQVSGLLRTT